MTLASPGDNQADFDAVMHQNSQLMAIITGSVIMLGVSWGLLHHLLQDDR